MSMASQGQPSRKVPSGPLLVQSLQPMQSSGSTRMTPKGGLSADGIQYMQSSMGQESTEAGEPAHPVQHSLMTARILGTFLRLFVMPVDLGSRFSVGGGRY